MTIRKEDKLHYIDETDISQEMIEAGVEALSLWDHDDADEWKVWHVYREMEKAKLRQARLVDYDILPAF